MKQVRHLLAWAASASAVAALPAAACSVGGAYRVPTNLELAGQAQAILLARVAGGTGDVDDPRATSVTLHPLAAVKGALPEGDIALDGLALATGRLAQLGVLSHPFEFEGAHPVSYIGACIRYIFPLGTTALFFLDRRDGEWVPLGDPFSRWAEDVPGVDAPWVRLTALYVRAAALAEGERKTVLEAERDALRARADDPVAQLMAADIDRQLAGPNEPWNVIMERQIGLLDEEAAATAVIEAARSAAESALEDLPTDGD